MANYICAIASKKRHAQLERCREVEGTGSDRILFGRWKARVKAASAAGSVPRSVLDAEGHLVTDPTEVLKVWRDFYKRLGKADVVPDVGDRAENGKAKFNDDFGRQVLQ